MNIQCIKLSTGEDLIGEVSENLSGYEITISKPMAVGLAQGPGGNFQVGLFPYLPFAASDTFKFRKENVILVYDPVIELRNQYSTIKGSGIVVANQPSNIHLV